MWDLGTSFWGDDLRKKVLVGALMCSLSVYHSVLRKKLTLGGAGCAFVMGVLLCSAEYVFLTLVFGFYYFGIAVTKQGDAHAKLQKYRSLPTTRNVWQVLANAGFISCMAVLHLLTVAHVKSSTSRNTILRFVHLAILGSLACNLGDTFASELGPKYARHSPVIILQPTKHVPVGTNGGVTPAGILFSCLGGFIMGLLDALFLLIFDIPYMQDDGIQLRWKLVVVGAVAGFLGSAIDSILGCTLQYSGLDTTTNTCVERPSKQAKYICGRCILSNNAVNLISTSITGILTPIMCHHLLQI